MWLLMAVFHALAPWKAFTILGMLSAWTLLAAAVYFLLDADRGTWRAVRRDAAVIRARLTQALGVEESWLYLAGGLLLAAAAGGRRACGRSASAWEG